MAHDARAVANALLDIAEKKGLQLTPMHILKLVYIAHGWNLAIEDEPLIKDRVEAWHFGPVVRPVFEAFKIFGNEPVTEKIRTLEDKDITTSERRLLERVVEVYGDHEAFELSGLTTKEGTPWHALYRERFKSGKPGFTIPNRLIKQQFLSLAQQNARSA